MVLLILESLGSTELLFILVMALVFFGPRKLPQLSRSLGKNLAEFRKASEDFKQTWEKEVNLEEAERPEPVDRRSLLPADSLAESSGVQRPAIEAITPDQVIARQSPGAADEQVAMAPDSFEDMTEESQTVAKHGWL